MFLLDLFFIKLEKIIFKLTILTLFGVEPFLLVDVIYVNNYFIF
jgi:hypothetical protein